MAANFNDYHNYWTKIIVILVCFVDFYYVNFLVY